MDMVMIDLGTNLKCKIGDEVIFYGESNQKKTESTSEKEAVATTNEDLLSSEEKNAGWQLLFDGKTRKLGIKSYR